MISVHGEPAGGGWVCAVVVEERGARTEHRVTVNREDLARWGTGTQRSDVEELVKRSFEFLLQREPPTSILPDFDLAVIQRYFPEYDSEFRRG